MRLTIYEPKQSNKRAFVDFWSARYRYEHEHRYDTNIGRILTEKRILELFFWKNGRTLSAAKRKAVQRNFIERRSELGHLTPGTTAEEFLDRFNEGGAIWRIFWLHCWSHVRFPMFDRHVYRAMRFIETGHAEDIPVADAKKIDVYIYEYLQFHRRFAPLDSRAVDKALWAFGKFVASSNFPLRAT